jgi:hypothetical protein
VLELVSLFILCWFLLAGISSSAWRVAMRYRGVTVASCAVASLSGAGVSAATIVRVHILDVLKTDSLRSISQHSWTLGSSVTLAICFVCQVSFAAASWISLGDGLASGSRRKFYREGSSSSMAEVKSIPYVETAPSVAGTRGVNSIDSKKSPSSSGNSIVDTISSIGSSLPQTIRPITSKTRLLSTRTTERHRPASLDSNSFRPSRDNSFDSWDTSSVDAHSRQTILDASNTSITKSRFLETIPASPIVSRTPSPGPAQALDLPDHPSRSSSRSYSPAPRQPEAAATSLTQHESSSESHIHPLFRSDSPTPPPVASPGTSVVASPNAGQVITPRPSIRSLNRVRSASLGRSPLSRQSSLEDTRQKKQHDESDSIAEVDEENNNSAAGDSPKEPIPEWVLAAGSRMSLVRYSSCKEQKAESESDGS